MSTPRTYCLFCHTGREAGVLRGLRRLHLNGFTPQAERWRPDRRVPERPVMALTPLLPGYVFFDADSEPDWELLRRLQGVIRVLSYVDGSHALRGRDMDFISWVRSFDGVIAVSQVVSEGSRIAFVSGPLAEMNGRVVKVNKKRRMVAVQFGEDAGLLQTVWCSIEYVRSQAAVAGTAE